MKIVEIGIEVLESDKIKEFYQIKIFDTNMYLKNFLTYYKKINPDEYQKNYDYLIKNDVKNPDKYMIDSSFKIKKKVINKKYFNALLKLIRKEKLKRLKLI